MRTNDTTYLQTAYNIALENANELKTEQEKLNSEYIDKIKLEETPLGTSDEKKKQIEAYNKQKQNEREIELPPIYEPLKLNLDLLYDLTEQLEFGETALKNMESILYVDGKALFLNVPMNQRYQTSDRNEKPDISFTGKEISIPAIYLTADTEISIMIHEKTGDIIPIEDWSITKVIRKDEKDASSYIATYNSKKIETYDFKKASELTIKVNCFGIDEDAIASKDMVYTYRFKVKNSKEWVFWDKAEFDEIEL